MVSDHPERFQRAFGAVILTEKRNHYRKLIAKVLIPHVRQLCERFEVSWFDHREEDDARLWAVIFMMEDLIEAIRKDTEKTLSGG